MSRPWEVNDEHARSFRDGWHARNENGADANALYKLVTAKDHADAVAKAYASGWNDRQQEEMRLHDATSGRRVRRDTYWAESETRKALATCVLDESGETALLGWGV